MADPLAQRIVVSSPGSRASSSATGDQHAAAMAFDRRAARAAAPGPCRRAFRRTVQASRSYAACTLASAATITTADVRPVDLFDPALGDDRARPGFSRKIARKIASNAFRSRVASPGIVAPACGVREPRDAHRDPSPHAQARPPQRRGQRRRSAAARAVMRPASSLPTSLSSATIATRRAHDFSASSIILRWRSLSAIRCRAAASADSRRRRWPACGIRERREKGAAGSSLSACPRLELPSDGERMSWRRPLATDERSTVVSAVSLVLTCENSFRRSPHGGKATARPDRRRLF